MKTIRTREKDLTPEEDREILELQHAAFVNTAEFAHQRWWHTPAQDDDLWFGVRDGEGKLISSVRVVHRLARTADGERLLAGIGNVCSHPEARGTGAASMCMAAVSEYIADDGGADFGLLFCGEALKDYYPRFGWRIIDNAISYISPDGERKVSRTAGKSYVMMRAGRLTDEQWPDGEIDLNGADW
jgi:predicted GNAT family N-acyltransferase